MALTRREMLKLAGAAAITVGLEAMIPSWAVGAPAMEVPMKTPIFPEAFKAGDAGYVFTPCVGMGGVQPADYDRVRKERKEQYASVVQQLGLAFESALNVDGHRGDFGKESRRLRLEDINNGVTRKVMWAARGGSSSLPMLDGIDYASFATHKPIVIGYSGMTPIINAITANSGLVTYHGPMVSSIYGDMTTKHPDAAFFLEHELQGIRDAVAGREIDLTPTGKEVAIMSYAPVTLKVERVNCPDRLEGVVLAGHFQGFCPLAGTPWIPTVDRKTPKLLFLEATHVDWSYNFEAMERLRLLGYLENAAFLTGIIYKEDVGTFLRAWSDEYGIPIIWGLRYGHLVPSATLPVGAYATFDTKSLVLKVQREHGYTYGRNRGQD